MLYLPCQKLVMRFKHNWLVDKISAPIGEARRIPVLEAIRWNRESLVQTLTDHGAYIHALAANPFVPEESNWGALHIDAHEGHERNLSLVKRLVEMGLPVEGSSEIEEPASLAPNVSTLSISDEQFHRRSNETPFAVAVRYNTFTLAETLLTLSADPNSLSLTSGLFAAPFPLAVLGHVITANAGYCHGRLNHFLNLLGKHAIPFIVEPTRNITALHRCAMAQQEIKKRTGGGAAGCGYEC